tara:strand:- start:1599 stop:2045 length:447 start_codon:yes stop_codon:yes gene_type:complete
MITECQNCNKKFELEDALIPLKGRLVQCGFCNSRWHQFPKTIKETPKTKVIDKIVIPKNKEKIQSKKNKKKVKNLNKIVDNNEIKLKKIGFFSYLLIFSISLIGLFLLIETFRYQITSFFPNLENYIVYIYETLNNILIFVKDLFKSY